MRPSRVTVHCSDTPNGVRVPVETVAKWHTDPPPRGRGWDAIGYHYLIQPDGTIDDGRSIDVEGAGVEGANQDNVHICLIGDTKFTLDQWNALRVRLAYLQQTYGIKSHEIFVHNQFPSAIRQGKSCPNVSINRLLAWYLLDDTDAILEHVI